MDIAHIEADLVAAMKARDAVTLGTLRMLVARLKNEKIASSSGDLSSEDVLRVIQSECKRRKEAAAEFVSGGRAELAEQELAEAAILEKYLPQQATEAELQAAIAELQAQHSWSAKDMGSAIKAVKDRFGAAADGALVARIVKETLKA